MSTRAKILIALVLVLAVLGGVAVWLTRGDTAQLALSAVTGTDPELTEPRNELVPTMNVAEPVGWEVNEKPKAAQGLTVSRFATGLDHPRILYTLPNGDVLATLTNSPPREGGGIKGWVMKHLLGKAGAGEPSPNKLVLLRDANGDGTADVKQVLRDDLDSPSGMAWQDGKLYIANHNALLRFDYQLGAPKLTGQPTKLMDLPGGGNHWMRNIALDPAGTKLYVAVGSASNIGENGMEAEKGRAAIWEYDLESGKQRQFAVGLRNPNGLDFNPWSGELWTTVNERDMLGSDLVPDYLTNVPVGAQYGWPWVYWKENVDRRVEAPMPAYLQEYARRPEYALGPHVAALGLTFTGQGNQLGEKFSKGAIIARHGSWNRKPPSGYDVVFIQFDDLGNPVGKPVPLLTGFLEGNGTTHGRPTWVTFARDGALLVSDDTAGIVWRVIAPGAQPNAAIERVERGTLKARRELRDPSMQFSDEFAREQNITKDVQ